MAEEIGMGIFCGSEWWDRPRMMPLMSPSSAQFCPAAESFDDICVGNFGRSVNYCLEDIESRSCKKTTTDSAARVSGNNFNFGSADCRIMSSPTTSISNYCSSGRANENDNIDFVHQEEMGCSRIQDWSPKNFPSTRMSGDAASMDAFKYVNQEISNNLDQPEPTNCASPTCQQGFSTSAFPFGYSPSVIQSLMEPEQIITNESSIMEFQSPLFKTSFVSSNQSPTSFPMFPIVSSQLGSFQAGSSPSQLTMPLLGEAVAHKIDFTMKPNNEDIRDFASAVKGGEHEPVYKRPRIETPLPTFKVRKEKLGDRVTALQQLVSPFGKNDTASVLHEAVEYIKFLHDHVSALFNQHLKNGVSTQNQHQVSDKFRGGEGTLKEDLRNRGLWLVPTSTAYAVASYETRGDNIWMPKLLGGTFL